MNILISGSTGLIGSALIEVLQALNHRVTRLMRSPLPSREPTVSWNPAAGTLNANEIDGFDAVVHLAGESIAAGRWTKSQKARILDSRVRSTALLSTTLANLSRPPQVLVCASASGYYGDRGDTILREDSGAGTGFLAEVCQQWESATDPAKKKGIRVVHLRTGIVLSSSGGALAKMLLPFKLGVGGVMGDGRQYWSWVALDDVIGAFHHALITVSLHGAVNVVAPAPVTNKEFSKTLGRVLSRPTIFPLPTFAARLALGEMADPLLFYSARIEPTRLLATGYKFHHLELEVALRDLLRKKALRRT
jgi:uncharacterized protein (TIGR01777 family)